MGGGGAPDRGHRNTRGRGPTWLGHSMGRLKRRLEGCREGSSPTGSGCQACKPEVL